MYNDLSQYGIITNSSRKPVLETDLVPLINVVFLLLVFFLVAGTALNPIDKSFEMPESFTGDRAAEDAISIKLTYDHVIMIGEMALSRDEASGLSGYIRHQLANNPQRQILINADARLPAYYLLQILRKVTQAGAQNVAIATRSIEARKTPQGNK